MGLPGPEEPRAAVADMAALHLLVALLGAAADAVVERIVKKAVELGEGEEGLVEEVRHLCSESRE